MSDRRRQASLFAAARDVRPLAARMRPRTLAEFVGQQSVLGPGQALRVAIEKGVAGSLILWGPPGVGKTTLGRLVAEHADRVFEPFSAVSEGVPRIRTLIAEAESRLDSGGRPTLLFVDEIHRLNTAQQDTLLPAVENGLFTMIGATTENPSFAINGALLSRSRVVVLQSLGTDDLRTLVERALADVERGLGARRLALEPEALDALVTGADGDARRALSLLEAAAALVDDGATIPVATMVDAMQRRFAHHDAAGEEHFNLLSAYHKSLRGSDPQAALYWMARLIEGGEDPRTLFRRAIAMAAEDVGLADPEALRMAVAAREAFEVLGAPEGYLPLSEMTIYLATAPKSNSAKVALDAALEAARQSPAAPVPLHLRNAPTALMRELGYGEGYRYAHDAGSGYIPQEYLPPELAGAMYYAPGPRGFEREIARRLDWWKKQREEPPRGEG
jgi:putative ATPase